MFEIKVTRTWDGRYLAVMPGIHPSCSSMGNTLQAAVRFAQASALNLMADFIRGNRQMPEAMREWFFVVSPDGSSTPVGGVRHGEIEDRLLIHPDNNVIPKRPVSRSRPNLPRHGTPEYDALMASMLPRPPRPPRPVRSSSALPPAGPVKEVPDADPHEER